jgi:hypothetical protein
VDINRRASVGNASELVFQQFRRDVPPSVKDAQDQHPFALDRESDADGAPIPTIRSPGMISTRSVPRLWKSR